MFTRLHDARARAGLLLTLALTLTVTGALPGCGSSSDNGVASKTPGEILAASRTAAESASSVHVADSSAQGPLTLTLNLELARDGGRGQVSLLGLSFEVIRVGNAVYIKGNRAFTARLPGAAAHLTPGTWLKLPNSGQLAQFGAYTVPSVEINRLLSSGNPVTKGATTTTNGQKAVELKQTGKLYTGKLYVAISGKPYPIQILKYGKETGHITFTNWNKPIMLTAPSNAVNINQLGNIEH